jgi:beta-fructofuranosidase
VLNGRGTYTRETLNLTVYVDNSVVEVYANDVTVVRVPYLLSVFHCISLFQKITTRVYPWLSNSTGAGFISTSGDEQTSVYVSKAELWDGLINAWPKRPADTRRGLVWDGPIAAIYGLWAGW